MVEKIELDELLDRYYSNPEQYFERGFTQEEPRMGFTQEMEGIN
jgi:hypothetical protein